MKPAAHLSPSDLAEESGPPLSPAAQADLDRARALAERSGHGFIYFVEAVGTNRIKIGLAANVKKRVGELQVGCPVDLLLLGFCSGSLFRERETHRRFDHLRHRGEWFEGTADLRLFIRKECR